MAQTYEYQSLSTERQEIRLLELHPSEVWDSPIECTTKIRPMDLTDDCASRFSSEPFEAVSYTWTFPLDGFGDSHKMQINLDGCGFQVTENLLSFLRHRRDREQILTLWADAICINQKDLLEKNKLIPLMGFIYLNAFPTTIWLGPASEDSDRAMSCLKALGAGSPYWKMPFLAQDTLAAIRKLLNRSWWKRVWIIQELVAGGFHIKMPYMQVRCGHSSISWMEFVVAAARMKCHELDRRQYFPNIDNILQLDALRDSPLGITPSMPLATRDDMFSAADLLSRFRHFGSTNPSDKIYAISRLWAEQEELMLTPRYEDSVGKVYTDLAIRHYDLGYLELLRHCGPRAHDVPSWVPDWSVDVGVSPLPARRDAQYPDVPWWLEPPEDESSASEELQGIEFLGSKQEYIAPPFTFRGYRFQGIPRAPMQMAIDKALLRERVEHSVVGFQVDHFDVRTTECPIVHTRTNMPGNVTLVCANAKKRTKKTSAPQKGRNPAPDDELLARSEAITRKQQERRVLSDLNSNNLNKPRYTSCGGRNHAAKVDMESLTLTCRGILWDTVDVTHEHTFPRDIEAEWQSATCFMVAVGSCKRLASNHADAVQRYPTTERRMEAFWLTLWAGPEQFSSNIATPFAEWLPEVNPSWNVTPPPLTPIMSGLLELAEQNQKVFQTVKQEIPYPWRVEHVSHWKSALDNIESKESDAGGVDLSTLIPEEWTPEELASYRVEFDRLGALWHEQPYDLYHRPFPLLNVVPDPYWECRRTSDEVARRNTCEFRSLPMLAPGSCVGDEGYPSMEEYNTSVQAIMDIMKNDTSLNPQRTLEHGLEKYALGRKFFVTRRGYFGLGPKDVQHGDRVAIIFGSDVPILLRKHVSESGQRSWQVVGESYIHEIMKGEVVEKWQNGYVEAGPILLR